MANSFPTVSLFALLLLSGCKGHAPAVTRQASHMADTVRTNRLIRDSVFMHDSIVVLRETLHDTVRETRYVYRYHYRDRTAADSAVSVRRSDTLAVRPDPATEARAVEAERTIRRLHLRQWLLLAAGILLSAILVVRKIRKSWPFS